MTSETSTGSQLLLFALVKVNQKREKKKKKKETAASAVTAVVDAAVKFVAGRRKIPR